jgi:alpha-1,3-rhamnosyl/mannosyltransferase
MVAQAPAEDWIFFVDELAAEKVDLAAPNLKIVRVAQRESPVRAAAADGHRSPADMLRFTRAVWRERPDVFFSPSVYTFFPLPPGLPAVVAIHDAIPERFPELTLPSRRARLFWTGKVRLALTQAKLILTVSRYAASELEQVLGVARARIRIAQNAPSPDYFPVDPAEARATAREHGVPEGEPWFTYVGGFNPHKRVDTIVRAHAQVVHEGGLRPHLLLVGSLSDDVFHGNLAEIRAAIEAAGTGDLVHWCGFVPDAALRALHSGATALVLVSESEGFGLPAMEAAACGTPVIGTTSSPLPELLPGGGLFVEPGDVERIAQAMRKLLLDPEARSAMGDQARRSAGALSWDDGARVALQSLSEAAGAERALAVAGAP